MQPALSCEIEYRRFSFIAACHWEAYNPAARSPYAEALLSPEFLGVKKLVLGCFNMGIVEEWRKKQRGEGEIATPSNAEAIKQHLSSLISADKFYHDQNSQVEAYTYDEDEPTKPCIVAQSPARLRPVLSFPSD